MASPLFVNQRSSVALVALVVVALATPTGCGFLSKLTRMPAAAGREAPPEKIEDRALAVGENAPPITLKDHTDSAFSLEQALQKGPVVVVFFRGEWCPLCARQLIELGKHAEELNATGATIVALNPDSRELSAAFAEETAWPYPILVDPTRDVIKAYGLYDKENDTAWPTIYIVDQQGVLRYRGLSETKNERPTSRHVLAALKAIPKAPTATPQAAATSAAAEPATTP